MRGKGKSFGRSRRCRRTWQKSATWSFAEEGERRHYTYMEKYVEWCNYDINFTWDDLCSVSVFPFMQMVGCNNNHW